MDGPLDDNWVKAVIDRRLDNGSTQREQLWTNPKTGEDAALLEKWAGVKNGVWNDDQQEMFAKAYERYLQDGKAPHPSLKGVFQSFRQWITQIYRLITVDGLVPGKPFSPEIIEMLKRYHGDVSDLTGEGGSNGTIDIRGRQSPMAGSPNR